MFCRKSPLFMYFEKECNGDVGGVAWPRELKQLTFGRKFNQLITQVVFHETFTQPLQGVTWRASPQTLVFYRLK